MKRILNRQFVTVLLFTFDLWVWTHLAYEVIHGNH